MGMFDEVRAINISHKNFDRRHNGHWFQTKSLDCTLSEYCVFNGVLYQEKDNSGATPICHEQAIKTGFTGELNIYTQIAEAGLEMWVEYDLIFEAGRLIDVAQHEVTITQDNRDLSGFRPSKPSNRIEVTISVANCDSHKREAFCETLSDEKLAAIRDILGEPNATIFYPIKVLSGDYPRIVSRASAVQTMEPFKSSNPVKVTAPNGDTITIFLDEFHSL